MLVSFKWYAQKLQIYLTISLLGIFLQSKGQGHYNGGSFNPNDYFIPPSSGWVFSLYYAYSNNNFFNASGNKTNVIEISQNPPVNIAMGQQVQTHSVIPMLLHFGKGKFLNAQWGFMVMPILNSPSANIALDYYLGQNMVGSTDVDIDAFGAGDFYIQPLWLTWNGKKISTTFSYGVWLPTGKYAPNDPGNVGLGYWSQNVRVASRYKPGAQTSIAAALTYEINGKQEGVDFREASHVTFDYGASYTFTKGHEAGLFGFGAWQTGNDKGPKVDLTGDHTYGIGVYGAYWIKPGKLSILGRMCQHFGVKNRYGGFGVQAGLNFLLIKS